MNVTYQNYMPALSGRLYDFLLEVYPNRKPEYLRYWIDNIENGGPSLWNKARIAFVDEEIVGCTLCCKIPFFYKDKIKVGYCTGNTIITPAYRGKGIASQFYSLCNDNKEWITIGFTIGGKHAALRYINNYHELRPINVYVSIIPWNIIFRPDKFVFKDCIKVGKTKLVHVKSSEELAYPSDGKWTGDDYEIIRDKEYIQSRFFDIYCAERYNVYAIIGNDGVQHGYVVFRTTIYKGIRALVVVDYRHDEKIGFASVLKIAFKVANLLKLCAVITMSSDNIGRVKLSPLTFNMKQLACATGLDMAEGNDLLFTSADSDLDFVYYR